MADCILVNSEFTADCFMRAFPSASQRPCVVHPGVKIPAEPVQKSSKLLLSLNRFERKKDLALAIRAFAQANLPRDTRLIVAGGYDERVCENREHLKELQQICQALDIPHGTHWRCSELPDSKMKVIFMPSIAEKLKHELLEQAEAVIYTPSGEHFGIVPLEAMARGCPVIAVDSGGPRETIVPGQTGFLCPSDPKAFAEAMERIMKRGRNAFAKACRERVYSQFSVERFGDRLTHFLTKEL